MPDITNNLAALRKQRVVSASALAGLAGVSRQTIYAIESGAYIPNTAVALRLAQVLDVTVHDLFSLPPPVSFFLPESAVSTSRRPVRRPAKIRLQIAGCDPATTLLARYLQPAGIDLIPLHRNSSQALALLKAGSVHLAGTHLGDQAVSAHFPPGAVAVFSFAVWQEGLLVARGNPKGIAALEDLSRKDVTFINREKGSGSRLVLDAQLKKRGIRSSSIRGYRQTAAGHLPAASAIQSGLADCCLATLAAGRLFDLHFIPLQTTRYDLAIRKQDAGLGAIQCLLDALTRLNLRKALASAAGYHVDVSASRIL